MKLGKAMVGVFVVLVCQATHAHQTDAHAAECAKARDRNFSAIRYATAVAAPEGSIDKATRPSIELACILLMSDREQASARLLQIFSQSTKAGQLYSLAALYHTDQKTFDGLAEDLEKDNAPVTYIAGDTASERTVADLVATIRKGQLPKIFSDFTTRWAASTNWATHHHEAGLR
jgi:hypothetical protein